MSDQPQRDLFGDLPAAAEALADDPDRWPERLAEITDWLIDETAAAQPQLAAPAVRRLAVRLTTRLAVELGGQQWYWPMVGPIERLLRDAKIWAEYDRTVTGPNGVEALARRHKLATNTIWAILRQEEERHRRRVQPELPGIPARPAGGSK